jgi:chorismate synthase
MIRYLTAGESHGKALVGILEGMPAGASLDADYLNCQLRRRQQGYGRGGRMKIETDTVEILSGVRFGRTLGSPIALMIRNNDWQNWMERMSIDGDGPGVEKITIPRPGHADFAGSLKYGFEDLRNVIERSSARETAMRVAVCTIARKILADCGIFIGSHVLAIGKAEIKDRSQIDQLLAKSMKKGKTDSYSISEVADRSSVRILNSTVEAKAISFIKKAKKDGDTLGGVFEVIVSGLPAGLGSYVQWDRRLTALLAQALMSIQAIKGVEIGDGFGNAHAYGSEVHDEFFIKSGSIGRKTNRAGGMEGGMTNGEPLIIRAAMKPISTLAHPLNSVDLAAGKPVHARYERSDVCAVPAASIVGEAVAAIPIANALLEKYGGDSLKELQGRLHPSM